MDFSNVDLALGTLTTYDSGSSVSSGSLAYAVGTAVLSQSLDLTQQMGASMIQMMEHSVNRNSAAISICTCRDHITDAP